jgi:tetratricopeptide (TPR) repeat protein
MKICPFLVAGQDVHRLRQGGTSFLAEPASGADRGGAPELLDLESPHEPDTSAFLDLDTTAEDTSHGTLTPASFLPEDAPARFTPAVSAAESTPSADSSRSLLWEMEDAVEPWAQFECLGTPCRFFHAGGCRFDALFASPGAATEVRAFAIGAVATTTAGRAPSFDESLAAPGVVPAGIGVPDPVPGSMLQEVWSLQRESLKELIGGFRRLEGAQIEQQSAVVGQVEGLVARVEDLRGASQSELVRRLEERFEALARSVEQVGGSLRGAGARAGTDLQATLAEVGASWKNVQAGLERMQTQLHGALGDIRAELSGSAEVTRTAVREAVDLSAEGTRTAMREALDRSAEGTRTAVREVLDRSAEGTRTAVREVLERSAAESRTELERSLSRVLDGSQEIRQLRGDLQTTVEALRSDVHDVAANAGKLEKSAQRTQELLDEHRRLAVDERERERRGEARRLNNAGVFSYHQGAYDTSVQNFQRALELDPRLTEAWNNLALTYTEMHADAEALEAFKKALELDPSVGHVYNNLGYLYHRRGELESAVEMYQRATQRSSDTSAAWANLANALYEMRRVDEAVDAWKRALEIDPANPKANSALERLGLAVGAEPAHRAPSKSRARSSGRSTA